MQQPYPELSVWSCCFDCLFSQVMGLVCPRTPLSHATSPNTSAATSLMVTWTCFTTSGIKWFPVARGFLLWQRWAIKKNASLRVCAKCVRIGFCSQPSERLLPLTKFPDESDGLFSLWKILLFGITVSCSLIAILSEQCRASAIHFHSRGAACQPGRPTHLRLWAAAASTPSMEPQSITSQEL